MALRQPLDQRQPANGPGRHQRNVKLRREQVEGLSYHTARLVGSLTGIAAGYGQDAPTAKFSLPDTRSVLTCSYGTSDQVKDESMPAV
jgi:hypothetical protein